MTDGSVSVNGRRGGVTEAAHQGDERTALLGFLQRQRDLVAWKVREAPDEVLRSVATASGLTLHGIVRHLVNVERSWVREDFAGQQDLTYDWTDDDPDGELHVPDDVTMASLLAYYTGEAALCDGVIAAASLDDVAVKGDVNLRWILLHLIEEIARHLGHIDLLRENADGLVGEDPAPN